MGLTELRFFDIIKCSRMQGFDDLQIIILCLNP